MDSPRSVFRSWLVAVSAGVLTVLVAGAAAVADSISTAPATAAAACRELFLPLMTPRSAAVLALGTLSFAVLLAGVWSLLRQLWAARRLRISRTEAREVTGERVWIVPDSRPLAFTSGALRPRVHLSSGALERLTDDQLRAVVAHEVHHKHRRDPLRIFVARALGDALFFVPAARVLTADYIRLIELDADAAAVAATGGKRPLAGALLVFADSPLVAGAGIAAERVDRLSGLRIRFALPLGLLPVGLAVFVAVIATAALLAVSGADNDGEQLPGLVEQACILGRALLPIAAGAFVVAIGSRLRAVGRAPVC